MSKYFKHYIDTDGASRTSHFEELSRAEGVDGEGRVGSLLQLVGEHEIIYPVIRSDAG